MNKKVYVVGSDRATTYLFSSWGWDVCHSVEGADLICFTGGADVSPELYEAPKHQYTRTDPSRDTYEVKVFHDAFQRGLPMVGICRGGQFLNVMNGGEMYQEVTGHGISHTINITRGEWEGLTVWATSTHHQMMRPAVNGKILAIGPESKTVHWDKQEEEWANTDMKNGVEVVMYGKHLCFQPHPEFMMDDARFTALRQYFFTLVKSLFNE